MLLNMTRRPWISITNDYEIWISWFLLFECDSCTQIVFLLLYSHFSVIFFMFAPRVYDYDDVIKMHQNIYCLCRLKMKFVENWKLYVAQLFYRFIFIEGGPNDHIWNEFFVPYVQVMMPVMKHNNYVEVTAALTLDNYRLSKYFIFQSRWNRPEWTVRMTHSLNQTEHIKNNVSNLQAPKKYHQIIIFFL